MPTHYKSNAQTLQPWDGSKKVYLLENVIDFSEIEGVQNDVVEALKIGAKQFVAKFWLEVTTGEGATALVDAGITGGDVDGFLDGVDLTAAGMLGGTVEANVAPGLYFAAEDTIDLLLMTSTTYDVAVVRAIALVVDLS